MKDTYDNIVLYINATCNLNCTYCYIDKSSILKQIDDILAKSFETDYYFDFTKEIFRDHPQKLKRIEFWGGEPSLGLHRMYKILPKFFNHFKNLNEFMMSTNFTTSEWFDEFYGFLKVLGKQKDRNFTFDLQLSLDGPEYFNDLGRGKGTTKKFLEHFDKFLDTIEENLPQNVTIQAHFKPTYTAYTISQLQTKEDIIKYFSFFDELIYKYKEKNNSRVRMGTPVPNTAVPSPHTKEDGLLFANYMKLTTEIDKEIRGKSLPNKYFKVYSSISSFIPRRLLGMRYNCGACTCGTGNSVIGILPERHLSACHNGFVDLLGDYKKNCEFHKDWEDRTILNLLFTNQDSCLNTCMTVEEYEKYEDIIDCFYRKNSTFQRLNLVAQIRTLAKYGQIDEKFIDEKEALKAADYFLGATSYCIRDNLSVTGSAVLYPVGLIKLLLNGASDYVLKE